MRTDHLLFGAAYYLEYLPYNRLETDMEMMERAGMNTIPHRRVHLEHLRAVRRRL